MNRDNFSDHHIALAPIQGITEYHFRNAFAKYFKGVDSFYAPYLRLDNSGNFKKSKLKDVLAENNSGIHLIPQIMTNDADEFIMMTDYLAGQGYAEVNWNLGCPYPMVTNRKLGSGLLPFPDLIGEILGKVTSVIKTKLSVKLRSGLESDRDIYEILPLLNQFPLTSISIHPRIGTELYRFPANREVFEKCLKLTKHKLVYNGDINSLDKFKELSTGFNEIKNWMIGRALISNPFLADDIKQNKQEFPGNKKEIFFNFHQSLVEQYLNSFSGPSHFLNRMLAFWSYFSLSFSNSHKVYKLIKKAGNINKFDSAIETIHSNEDWIEMGNGDEKNTTIIG